MIEWIILYFIPLWILICTAYETKQGWLVLVGLIPVLNMIMVLGVFAYGVVWVSDWVINKIHERNNQ